MFGGEDGRMEFWDPRVKSRIGQLNVGESIAQTVASLDEFPEITSLDCLHDGITFATGTKTGHVSLYDLRKPEPLLIKDHQYGFPIKSITFHSSGNVISADSKIVKIWNRENVNNHQSL